MPIPHFSSFRKESLDLREKIDTEKRYYIGNKKPKRRFNLKLIAGFFVMAGVCGLISFSILLLFISKDLPDPNKLMEREVAQSTKIYDRTGDTVLFEIFGDEKRTLVSLDEIPDYVKWATIAIEDKNFYKHKGFSIMAIVRTVVTNVIYHKKAGGSTLTQQFIKNAILTSEKTYTRKIKEVLLAYRAEQKFTKDQILQLYLNEIPYGSTAYGVEAASKKYFGKSVKEVSLAEAAILAALPQAPSRYSPYGPNRDLLIDRQKYILDLMVEQGYISEEEALQAKQVELVFKEQENNILAPHFVMYIKELLADKYGEKLVEQGGLRIYTTLDLYKQKIAEEVVRDNSEKNTKDYDAWNAGLIAIDPKTGQILAMVGSKDYFGSSSPETCVSGKDCKFEPNDNVTTRPRQPGSSLKPIVYATTFIRGYTPNTVLYDVKTNFSVDKSKRYEPDNYDGKERGPITMRRALAGSLNIPAVKALYLAGIENVISLTSDLGYSTLKPEDRDRFGLSLVLGGGEVKLIEHVNAYSAFAREGELHDISAIIRIEDQKGNIIEEYSEKKQRVVDAEIAREINDILSDNNARSYIFGERNWLTLGNRPVAAKTGTTNDYRDAWTIGYTPSLVAGVWVGNNDNSPMKRGSDGSVVAAPIWNAFMKKVLGETPVEKFNPSKIPVTGKPILDGKGYEKQTVKIDRITGLLATEFTPQEYVVEQDYAKHHSILYYVIKEEPRGEYPKNPANDPQYELWEEGVKKWVESQKDISTSTPPTEYDNVHIPENKPTIAFNNLSDAQEIHDSIIQVSINTDAPRGVAKVDYLIDNNIITTLSDHPFDYNKDISFLPNGFHELKARACDDVGNCSEAKINLNIMLAENGRKAPSIEWLSPNNGLALTYIDFPLELSFKLIGFQGIKKVKILTKGSSNIVIGEINNISGEQVSFFWDKPPTNGTYELFAEATTWEDKAVESGSIILTVANSTSIN